MNLFSDVRKNIRFFNVYIYMYCVECVKVREYFGRISIIAKQNVL